ncbi:MAG: hypothetical protein MPI95_00195 [Nitrosopumilus sp.]|nr:hypothetical protein [Nitrosopumilus sp.]MDA7957500.1 hypothetical protein [Nitrosopumilus sp.]
MVKLSETIFKKGRGESYIRCMGDTYLSLMLSRVQSLIIKSGYNLEDMILAKATTLYEIDDFLEHEIDGTFLVPKKAIKKSQKVNFNGVEPDFMVLVVGDGNKTCHLVELKDGCDFDTKSAEAEYKHMNDFITTNARKLQYRFEGHICCFNETSRDAIVAGFKNKITTEIAMTGREFCELINLDYDSIVLERKRDQRSNFKYFISEILKDESVRLEVINVLKTNNWLDHE